MRAFSVRPRTRATFGLALLLLLALASLDGGGSVAAARALASSVVSFSASPSSLPSTGGNVLLTASVQNASSCTFAASPKLSGLPTTIDCSAGSASDSVAVPANATGKTQSYSFQVTAKGSGKSAQAMVTVTVSAAAAPSVTSFAASPAALPSGGGSVSLVATVSNASTCTFSVSPKLNGFPTSVACTSGGATKTANLPANTTQRTKSYSFSLTAPGAGSTQTGPIIVTVAAVSSVDTTPPGPITALT